MRTVRLLYLRERARLRLTPRQSGVAACLLDGMGNKEIAGACGLELDQVEWDLRSLLRIFQARNRVLLALALQREVHGWRDD
jgi:DNA-binding CsgD family transcriptional regulator